MDNRSPHSAAQQLNPDMLFLIFSLVAGTNRPALCSCARHAPSSEQLRQRACCDRAPNCNTCIFGAPVDEQDRIHCVYSLGWITLGHVCRQWRSALQEANNLWADDLCTLNNSAIQGFLSHVGNAPLNIDLTPEHVQNLLHPASRRERTELLRPLLPRARIFRSGWYDWIPTLSEQHMPFLQELELSTEDPSTVAARNLLHAVLHQSLRLNPTHVAFSGPPLRMTTPSLRRLTLRNWSSLRCDEIPQMLTAVTSIEELVLDICPDHIATMISDADARGVRDMQGSPLSLPSLKRLHINGRGTEHPALTRLLEDLTARSQGALMQLWVEQDAVTFTQSRELLEALKTHIHNTRPDSVSLQFRGKAFVISTARTAASRFDDNDFSSTTMRLNELRSSSLAPGPIAKTTVFPLLPVENITHLFLDSLPEHSARFTLSSVLRQLNAVHTIHLSAGSTDPASSLLEIGLYPLVGLRPDPWLPALKHLHISYYGDYLNWWEEVARALVARKRLGVPFITLRIIGFWGLNILRPQDDAPSPLDGFQEQGVDRDAPDAFLASVGPDVFSHNGSPRWPRNKVADISRSLFAQVVETVEVVDEVVDTPVWPPSVLF
ncbi:hypothetical protein PENSPDRAFT_756381 [Peniophora sp. CONT]|nr:hypothetical protein PENSPDRAFT_756381 [Peniophora sp. CONT]